MAQRSLGDLTTTEAFERMTELKDVEKLVTAEIARIQGALEATALADGVLELPGYRWTRDTGWATSVDWERLQALLGAAFHDVISTSKAALERRLASDPVMLKQALGYLARIPVGTVVKKTKTTKNGEG